ncbi:unnamed protein product [Rotaria sordida]|uniref:Uncharacterized protein n=1 Tax=Rotaria sordida TaxID=392033 RepID=A0A819T5I2_9BILA|nr:unnamed protein product [Rotaria sordida]
MSNSLSNANLTQEILSFRNETFYNLVEQQCSSVALEIMQLQHISSVDCLLETGDIFAVLQLDSDELIPIKRKSTSSNFESDDQTNFDEHENFTNNYDNDEEFELNNNFDES